MFTTVRYFVKTAFAFFIIGFMSGIYMYAGKVFDWYVPASLISAHTHIMLLGGMMMMIIGVGIWFFPRPTKDDTKYNPKVILFFYWVFTIATSLRFISEVTADIFDSKILALGGFASAAFQIVSMIGLIYSLWDRIRPIGSQIREQKGELF